MNKRQEKAFNKVLKTVGDKFEIGIDGKVKKVKLCPKCGAKMWAWKSGFGKNQIIDSYECSNKKCGYEQWTEAGLESMKKIDKEVKEGRVYLWSCQHVKKGLFVCPDCVAKECDKWYKLGRKDERNQVWKPKKFQRQGFGTSIKELKEIIKELEKEQKVELKRLGMKQTKKAIEEQKWQLAIINTEGASDTWRFERIT